MIKLYDSLGFKNIVTFIQSGNVLFSSPKTDIDKLTKSIEKQIRGIFGFDVAVIIYTKAELGEIINKCPFSDRDESKIYVTLLKDIPASILSDELKKMAAPNEDYLIFHRAVYFYFPNGYGHTKLSNNYIERKLKVTATTRNWKTITSIYELA